MMNGGRQERRHYGQMREPNKPMERDHTEPLRRRLMREDDDVMRQHRAQVRHAQRGMM